MKQVQLLFCKNVLLSDSQSMKLDYSLTEMASEADQMTPYYGARITKYLGDTIESDEVCGISESKDMVISIIQKLYQHEVTPISMVEIVDELVTCWSV
jgi:hypothetical protein